MLSLARWNPFEELTNLHREVDRVFGRSWSEYPTDRGWSWVPSTEVTSTEDGWTLKLALPGVDPEHVHVDLRDRVLTVSGERTMANAAAERHTSEIGYGSFERSFTLPQEVDADKITARFNHGMLELTLPVAEATKPRRIEVTGDVSAHQAA